METRVDKLDALQLDQELYSHFDRQLEKIIQPLATQRSSLYNILPEVRLLSHGFLLLNSLFSHSTTPGHHLLHLRLIDTKRKKALNESQVAYYTLVNVLIPYVRDRCSNLDGHLQLSPFIETIYRCTTLFNNLLFIVNGRHPSVWSRVASIDSTLITDKQRVPVDYILLNRSLLWSTFAECLSNLIHLVDFRRLKKRLRAQILARFAPQQTVHTTVRSQRTESDLKECAICLDWPNDPHEIGCQHVFCYYCIYSDFLSLEANQYFCPKCSYKITDPKSIKQLAY